jgi:histidine triad (HIT) family protein
MTVDKCVFCERISRGEFSMGALDAVAFEPLNPVTPGHLLVVPLEHVSDAIENPAVAGMTFQAAAQIAHDQRYSPCNLITSAGSAATQTVFHLHVHIVPRREGDGLHLPWTGQRRL